MLRKLVGAAAMAASAFAFVPAQAAHVHHAMHVGVGCSGDNFAKAEGTVETMADSPAKFLAEREIAQAQDAMLSDKMSGCAMHLAGRCALKAWPKALIRRPWPRLHSQVPSRKPRPKTCKQRHSSRSLIGPR